MMCVADIGVTGGVAVVAADAGFVVYIATVYGGADVVLV